MGHSMYLRPTYLRLKTYQEHKNKIFCLQNILLSTAFNLYGEKIVAQQ